MDQRREHAEQLAAGDRIDRETPAQQLTAPATAAESEPAVDRGRVFEHVAQPRKSRSLGRIAHEVAVAARQDHQVAGREPHRLRLPVDLHPTPA